MFEISDREAAFKSVERAGLKSIVQAAAANKSSDSIQGVLLSALARAGSDIVIELANQVGSVIASMTDLSEAQDEITSVFDLAKQSTIALTRTAGVKAGMGGWIASVFGAEPGQPTQAQKERAKDKQFIWERDTAWVGKAMGVPPAAAAKAQTKDARPIWEREADKSQDDKKRSFLRSAGFDPEQVASANAEEIALIMGAAEGVKSGDNVDMDELLAKVQLKNRGKK